MERGGTSESAFAGDLPIENGRRQFQVKMNPADLTCPVGEGPCLVYLEYLMECPNGKTRYSTRTAKL
jgi:hypothetical protein